MTLTLKARYCDRETLIEGLNRIVAQIEQAPFDFTNLAFIGILTGGAPIADYLADRLAKNRGIAFPVAYVDITLYRDDMIDTQFDPYARAVEIPFSLKNREVVLVDDVLFTGRTVRAALTTILALGRPRLIRFAAVVDRGCRELPIQADFVAFHIETTRRQGIRVRTGLDEASGIYIYEQD